MTTETSINNSLKGQLHLLSIIYEKIPISASGNPNLLA